MTRRSWVAAGLLVAMLLAATALTLTAHRGSSRAGPAQKVPLSLLTTLPIMFGEDFSLKGAGSPALTALKRNFTVAPVSTANAKELGSRVLLMAQPPAQTPENLVSLDEWVRRGGRVLLFADPLLEWPSKRQLGDPLRLPPMFADTGLLMHWGLRLDAPDRRGPAARTLAGYTILTVSPGALNGACSISQDRLVADCRIGKGRAVVVADADLLDVPDLGPGARNNLTAVTQILVGMTKK